MVIGGIVTNTRLTLLVLPTLYTAFRRKQSSEAPAEAPNLNAENGTP